MEFIREILIKPASYWLITIVPAALTYISFIPENKRGRFMNEFFSLFPFWVWLTIALIAFVVTILISVNNYVKKIQSEHKQEVSRLTANANNGGQAFNIQGSGNTINPLVKEIPPPVIALKISIDNEPPSQTIRLQLNPLPAKGDIESLVEARKQEVIVKNQADVKTNRIEVIFKDVNLEVIRRQYPQRLENYVKKYRSYLNDLYDNSIIEDRYKSLSLILEIQGLRSISNVHLHLEFPSNFPFPPNYIKHLVNMNDITFKDEDGNVFTEKYEIDPPNEPVVNFPDKPSRNYLDPGDYYSTRNEKIDTGRLELSKGIAKFEIPILVHNLLYESLPFIHMWLGNIDLPQSWQITYKIYSIDIEKSPIVGTVRIEAVLK